ncbi:MAG: hypothetical protein IJH34_08075 [Romboutsia sp.]|nr:hypothetical protein [Romboutsia sp.]
MTREEFDSKEIMDQIKYVNDMLDELSLNKICDSIGISRAGLSKRFSSVNFVFNKKSNQYMWEEDIITNEDVINELEFRLKELTDRVTILEQLNNESVTDTQQINNSNTIRFYKNDTIVRAYRIDDEIYQRFKHYTDENRQYKISDIISTALEDFLNIVGQ